MVNSRLRDGLFTRGNQILSYNVNNRVAVYHSWWLSQIPELTLRGCLQ